MVSRLLCVSLIATAMSQGCAVFHGWLPGQDTMAIEYQGWDFHVLLFRVDADSGAHAYILFHERARPASVRILPTTIALFGFDGSFVSGDTLDVNTSGRWWPDPPIVYGMFGDRDAHAYFDSVSLPDSMICRIRTTVLELRRRTVFQDSVDIILHRKNGIYFTGGV